MDTQFQTDSSRSRSCPACLSQLSKTPRVYLCPSVIDEPVASYTVEDGIWSEESATNEEVS